MRAVRRRAIEAARLARRFGIILGTLGRQGNPAILAHLEALFTGRGMRYSVVLLSEVRVVGRIDESPVPVSDPLCILSALLVALLVDFPACFLLVSCAQPPYVSPSFLSRPQISPAKLNAMSDVEAWVQIACPRLSIDWGEGFRIPARTRHTQHTPGTRQRPTASCRASRSCEQHNELRLCESAIDRVSQLGSDESFVDATWVCAAAAWTSGVLCCVPAVKLMLMTVSLWFRGLLLSQVLTPYEAEVAFGEIPPFWDESKGSSGCDGAGSGGASCGAGGTCGRNDGGSCSGAGAGPDAGVGAGNRRVAAYPMDFYAKDSGPWGNGFHNSRRTVPGRPPGVR